MLSGGPAAGTSRTRRRALWMVIAGFIATLGLVGPGYAAVFAGPPGPLFAACAGQVTSLDNNLFVDPRCAVALLPNDLTGDPRLGDFTDDGTPGHGFFPLLRHSPTLNAANDAACLPTDQRDAGEMQKAATSPPSRERARKTQ